MIACKALKKYKRMLRMGLYFLAIIRIEGHDYLTPRLYEFDRNVLDYSQRHLSDNFRYLMFHSQFTVKQTGYANSSGNLANLTITTNFAAMASSAAMGLAPEDFDRDLYNAERFAVHFYESLARRWERLNPIPGLYYVPITRNSAYPFIFMEGYDQIYTHDLGTFPFIDDLKFQQYRLDQRQYALAFQILFN